jgi:cytoskeletal protein RodZ
MNDQQLWGWLAKWFPMLFDLLTVLLLVAGCVLIWTNFRPRRRKGVRAPKETSDQGSAASHPKVAAQQSPWASSEHGANYSDAFPAEEPVSSDPSEEPGKSDVAQIGSATTSDQNSYADRVASAMAKLRKPSPGL